MSLRLKKKKTTWFDVINVSLVTLITVIVAYPLYFCVIASLSDPTEVASGNTLLWIKQFSLEAYRLILKEDQLWTGYRNTIIYTVLAVLYRLILTIPAGYALSKKNLPGRGTFSLYFFFTMYVSGGMVPEFLLMKKLGLINNPLSMVVGAGVSCYNLIITRQFFESSIPTELYEAAYIDGASEWRTFKSIALPLSKPIIAVLSLYVGVGAWNEYYKAMLYIYKKEYYPLQLVLRNILSANQLDLSEIGGSSSDIANAVYRAYMAQNMKYSIVIVASLPLIIAYPFLQKYFAQGAMVGSVKG